MSEEVLTLTSVEGVADEAWRTLAVVGPGKVLAVGITAAGWLTGAVLDALVHIPTPSCSLVSSVAPTTDTHVGSDSLVRHTLLPRGAGLCGAAAGGLDLHAALPGGVSLEARRTLAREGTGLVATDGPDAARVVGALVDVRAAEHAGGVAGVALATDALGLAVDQLATSVGAAADILAWI